MSSVIEGLLQSCLLLMVRLCDWYYCHRCYFQDYLSLQMKLTTKANQCFLTMSCHDHWYYR